MIHRDGVVTNRERYGRRGILPRSENDAARCRVYRGHRTAATTRSRPAYLTSEAIEQLSGHTVNVRTYIVSLAVRPLRRELFIAEMDINAPLLVVFASESGIAGLLVLV